MHCNYGYTMLNVLKDIRKELRNINMASNNPNKPPKQSRPPVKK